MTEKTQPTDKELEAFAVEEQFLLFCDVDEFTQIARAVLAHFLNLGTQTGSWALGSTFADFFVDSLQTTALHICDVAQQHVIDDLVDVNWGPDEPAPRLVFDEIGATGQATAEAMKLLLDAGALTSDEQLEAHVRAMYGLPVKEGS